MPESSLEFQPEGTGMLVVTRQRRSWSKGSLPLQPARFRYEDVSSCLRLTAERLDSKAETVTLRLESSRADSSGATRLEATAVGSKARCAVVPLQAVWLTSRARQSATKIVSLIVS